MGEPVYAPHIDEVNKAMHVSIAEVSRNNTIVIQYQLFYAFTTCS